MRTLLLALFIVAAGAGVSAYLRLNGIVRDLIERYGSQAAGTAVTLRSVSLSPFSGSGRLRGLSVANPAGYSKGSALSVEDVRVSLEPRSLLGCPVIVREVTVDSPAVLWEMRLGETNLGRLRRNLEGGAAPQKGKKAESPGRKVIIKDFIVKGGRIEVASAVTGKAAADLPAVHLRDIGAKSGGATMQDAVSQTLDAIFKAAIEGGGGLRSAGKILVEKLGGLFGKKKR